MTKAGAEVGRKEPVLLLPARCFDLRFPTKAPGQPAFVDGGLGEDVRRVREPEEIEDPEHEQVVARVAAIDVAKATGMVCSMVPHTTRLGQRKTKVWGDGRDDKCDRLVGRSSCARLTVHQCRIRRQGATLLLARTHPPAGVSYQSAQVVSSDSSDLHPLTRVSGGALSAPQPQRTVGQLCPASILLI